MGSVSSVATHRVKTNVPAIADHDSAVPALKLRQLLTPEVTDLNSASVTFSSDDRTDMWKTGV